MQNQIQVEICKKCKGKGGFLKVGKVCDNCRGSGVIGRDETSEYYLERDGKGGLKIVSVKSKKKIQTTEKSTASKPKISLQKQKTNVLRMLLILFLIISYLVFLGIYFTMIKNPKVFWTVTIIALGFFFLSSIYNSKLINTIPTIFSKIIRAESQDFVTAIGKNRNSKNEIGK